MRYATKHIEDKNTADRALLVRTALSVLENCDYDIVHITDAKLIRIAQALAYNEAKYISEGYREYANYSAENFSIHIEHIISHNADRVLSLIKGIHKVVMDNRREFSEKLKSESNPPPVLPPDHIIF